MRKATMNASDQRFAPTSAAKICSRTSPRTRDVIVAAESHTARPTRTGAAGGAAAAGGSCGGGAVTSVLPALRALRGALLLHHEGLRLRLDGLRDVAVARELL